MRCPGAVAALLSVLVVATGCADDVPVTIEPTQLPGATEGPDGATDDAIAGDDQGQPGGDGDDQPLTGDDAVTILGTDTGAAAAALLLALDPYLTSTGTEIDYKGSADATRELLRAVRDGSAPDLAIVSGPSTVRALVQSGAAVAVPTGTSELLAASFDPAWIDAVSEGGEVFAVPNEAAVNSLVWYSPERFDENGYEVPETWDDLTQLVDQVKQDGNVPFCFGIKSGGRTGWVVTDWIEDRVLGLNGPEVYDEWVANDISFDDDRVAEAVQAVADIWFGESNVLGGRSSIAETRYLAAGLPIIDGDCMMHRQGDFYASEYTDAGAAIGPDGDVDAFVVPGQGNEAVVGTGSFIVALNAEPATMATLAYMATAAYADVRIAADTTGFVSSHRDQNLDLYGAEFDREMARLVTSAEILRIDGSQLMPAAVGEGSFPQLATEYVIGAIDLREFLAGVEASFPD